MGELGEYWRDVDAYFKDRARNPEKYFSKQEIDAYNKRAAKRAQKREEVDKYTRKILAENNVEIKEHNNGQWTLNGIIDWWTTTGTAIHRKTRNKYHFTKEKPEEIVKVINNC